MRKAFRVYPYPGFSSACLVSRLLPVATWRSTAHRQIPSASGLNQGQGVAVKGWREIRLICPRRIAAVFGYVHCDRPGHLLKDVDRLQEVVREDRYLACNSFRLANARFGSSSHFGTSRDRPIGEQHAELRLCLFRDL